MAIIRVGINDISIFDPGFNTLLARVESVTGDAASLNTIHQHRLEKQRFNKQRIQPSQSEQVLRQLPIISRLVEELDSESLFSLCQVCKSINNQVKASSKFKCAAARNYKIQCQRVVVTYQNAAKELSEIQDHCRCIKEPLLILFVWLALCIVFVPATSLLELLDQQETIACVDHVIYSICSKVTHQLWGKEDAIRANVQQVKEEAVELLDRAPKVGLSDPNLRLLKLITRTSSDFCPVNLSLLLASSENDPCERLKIDPPRHHHPS